MHLDQYMGQLAKLTPRSDKVRVHLQVGFFTLFLRAQKEFGLNFFLLERYVFLVSSKKFWWSDTTDEILNTTECYRKTQKNRFFVMTLRIVLRVINRSKSVIRAHSNVFSQLHEVGIVFWSFYAIRY